MRYLCVNDPEYIYDILVVSTTQLLFVVTCSNLATLWFLYPNRVEPLVQLV